MPQIFKIGGYIVYIWSDEGCPTEPVHVHISREDLQIMLQKFGLQKIINVC